MKHESKVAILPQTYGNRVPRLKVLTGANGAIDRSL